MDMGKLDLNIERSTLQDKGEIIVIIFYLENDLIFDKVSIFWLNFCQLWKKLMLLK